jgi:hypothetical protein
MFCVIVQITVNINTAVCSIYRRVAGLVLRGNDYLLALTKRHKINQIFSIVMTETHKILHKKTIGWIQSYRSSQYTLI